MTKKELINVLAQKQGVSQIKAGEFLDAVKSTIMDELSVGGEVNLGSDFGTFKPTKRSGIIPGTQTKYSSNSVKFSTSAAFKRKLK